MKSSHVNVRVSPQTISFLLIAVAALFAGSSLLILPASWHPQSQVQADQHDDVLVAPAPEEDTNLHDAMHMIGDLFRSLRQTIREPDMQAQTLADLHAMQQYVLHSKVLVPRTASRVSDSDRPAFVTEYRLMQLEFNRMLIDCEVAILENRYDDGFDLLRQMQRLKNRGHDKFE